MFMKIASAYVNGIIPQFMNGASPFFYYGFLILGVLLVAITSYLLGSLNFALILSKKMYGQDIRKFGSNNAGTTNMMRTYGKKAAFLTILGDIAKGIVAVLIGRFAMGVMLGGYVAALFCVIGHIFPLFYGFKGGKGVATAAATILMLNPVVFCFIIIVFILTVVCTRYISLGSVLAAALFPLLTFYSTMPSVFMFRGFAFLCSFLMAVLVIAKHHQNISRLAHGTESKFSFKKSKTKQEVESQAKTFTITKKNEKDN